MSKIDTYQVTVRSGTENHPIDREVTVLLEEGDIAIDVLKATDLLIIEEGMEGASGLKDSLLALTETEFRDLITEIWTEQMTPLGNDKFAYANRLRQDVNTAQNNS